MRPTTAVWLNFAFLILTGAAAGSVDFGGIPTAWVPLIKSWCANAAWMLAMANMVFHLWSAPSAGPMYKLTKGL